MKSRFLSEFFIPLQFYGRLFLCTFSAQTICTLLKRSLLNLKSLRLSSAQVKICQILYALFFKDKSIPFQILHPSSVSWKITPLYFFSSNNIYFAQKEHIKMKIFGTFKCSGQNSSNSTCQFWNDKSILLQNLHDSSLSWHITSLGILSL